MDVNESFRAKWHLLKGNVLKQWGKLTNDDLDKINGSREVLIGKLMNVYGKTKEEAEKEVNRFLS